METMGLGFVSYMVLGILVAVFFVKLASVSYKEEPTKARR